MKIKETKIRRFISRAIAIAMTFCLMFSAVIAVNAAEANERVHDAKSGVVQIQVWFYDVEAAHEEFVHSGTGFLINENTIVTCQHVANGYSDEEYLYWTQMINAALGGNRTVAEVKEKLELRVSVYRDVYVKATVKKASTEMDYAVLTLNEPIKDRVPLKLRDSSTLRQTEEVFALGFPDEMVSLENAKYYDVESVEITGGKVNRIADMSFDVRDSYGKITGRYNSVNCVEHGAIIAGGNSGGPLVDADGNVVGINAAGSSTRNIAIASKQLIDVLNALGISYTSADAKPSESPTEKVSNEAPKVDTGRLSGLITEAEAVNAHDYSEESYKNLKNAVTAAKSALTSDSQSEIDKAASELKNAIDALENNKAKSPMGKYGLIIVIALVAVAIIAVVIVLVVLGKKKSKPQAVSASAPVVQAPASKAVASAKPVAPASSETTVLSQGSSETTVLSQGAGETTVLSQNVHGGTLVRLSNNERIPICAAEFTVGRERSSVDYCVGGNTNISRVHARFVVRNGATYIVDNKAANGTFVNGVKARAGQEIQLKNGDKIVLADEKFEFNK